jgi:hypothetical protein
MKKYLIILILLFTGIAGFAQKENDDSGAGGKIRDRMVEYIQDRLGLSRKESEKFSPVFLRYFHEFRQIRQQNKGDRLVFQQKVIDLRIRYRDQFRQIMPELKANKVFVYEDEFRKKAIQILEARKDRLGGKPFRNHSLLQ